MTTIYVGNLPFSATEDDVRSLFEAHGTVESVKLINDRETGRPRGFGFVDMPSADAQKAIAAGIPGEQVDGNDVIAVHDSVARALATALAKAIRATSPGAASPAPAE